METLLTSCPHGLHMLQTQMMSCWGMHNMHMQASQVSLCNIEMPQSTYWPSMHVCQPLTTKSNHFTFSGTNYPKCKWEHALDGSHCIMQWEKGCLQ